MKKTPTHLIPMTALGPKALVAMFARNQCTQGDGLRVAKDDLHRAFMEWAARNGRASPMAPSAFGHYLMDGTSIIPRRIRADDGRRVWVYERIALNEY